MISIDEIPEITKQVTKLLTFRNINGIQSENIPINNPINIESYVIGGI
jgi:hypothetical protein